jgi:hypothetical protein
MEKLERTLLVERLLAHIGTLVRLVYQYGQHHPYCKKIQDMGAVGVKECTCGFDEAMAVACAADRMLETEKSPPPEGEGL